MAIAFVTRTRQSPPRSSARADRHLESYLEADEVHLSDELLDRIDAIVPPGQTINEIDNMWGTSTTALQAPGSAAVKGRPEPGEDHWAVMVQALM